MFDCTRKQQTYVLGNVNVLDGKGNKLMGVDIEVDNGHIKNIHNQGWNNQGLPLYDLNGFWVMPGMIDMHVHLCSETPEQNTPRAQWRMTTPPPLKVLSAASNCGHVTYYEPEDVALGEAVRNGTIVGPRIIASAGGVTMTAGHGDLCFPSTVLRLPEYRYGEACADGVSECMKRVREKVRNGADFIKIFSSGGCSSHGDEPHWPNFTLEETKAIVETAHALERKVASHTQGESGAEIAIQAGVDTIEHGCSLTEEMCQMMAEKGIFLVPTVKVLRALCKKKSPHMRLKAETLIKKHMKAIEYAKKAGVKMAFGTDTSGFTLLHGENADELVYLSQCGISNKDLIIMATSRAAEALGMEEEIGSVEEGKAADLLIIDTNPEDDITVLTSSQHLKGIIRDGHFIKADIPNVPC